MIEEKFYVYLEDGTKKVDPNFDSYNSGTQEMLDILDDCAKEYNEFEDYLDLVESLEECRCEEDIERVMYGQGTDYIDEMEVHKMWMDIMFPRPEKSPHINYDI